MLLKTVLRIEEPISTRGGMIMNVFKGNGSAPVVSTSRGMNIADGFAQKAISLMRSQGDGLPGGGIDVCSFIDQSFSLARVTCGR